MWGHGQPRGAGSQAGQGDKGRAPRGRVPSLSLTLVGPFCYSLAAVSKNKIAEELKQPDQFVDFWTHAWQRAAAFLGPRKKPVLAIVVAGGVVMIGAAVMNKIDNDKRIVDSQSFARIQEMATADLLPADDDKNAAALAALGKKADEIVRRFKLASEREGAVLTDVDQFLSSHPSTHLKPEALLLKGAALLASGKFDDAVSAYKGALDAKLDTRLRFLANEGLVYAYEGKSDWDSALSAANALSTDAQSFQGFFKERATYQKARLTERKGDKAGAVKLYREILDKVADSPLHETITDRLALLEAK